MSASICWMCQTNFAFHGYKGTEHLDEEGNKPCLECLAELEIEQEELEE